MAVSPRTTTASTDSPFSPGSLVVYENDGVALLAAVLASKKDKYTVLNDRGRELELTPVRFYKLPGTMPGDCATLEAKEEYLASLREEAARFATTIDLEEIWTFLHEDASEFSNKHLCETYFGTNDLIPHLGLRLALLSDVTYFKRNKETFTARPPEVVEELKKAREAREKKDLVQKEAIDFVGKRLKDKTVPLPPELHMLVASVADLAALSPHLDNAHQKDAIEFIDRACEAHAISLTGQPEAKAYNFLLRIGVFDKRTNPRVIRHNPPIAFSEEALAEVKHVRVPEVKDEYEGDSLVPRRDLTALRTFTIDDTTTKDMDDALSLEEHPGGYTLYVHISDVASFLGQDSLLDRESRLRATSLYLPERKVHMLPPALSEGQLSLVVGHLRPALTCIISINRSFEVVDSEIVASLIQVSERFDYDVVDEAILQGVHEFDILHQIASTREMQRISQGGFKVHKRDIGLYVNESGEIEIKEVDEDSPARSMIGEMMILANECMANFCKGHGLAAPYRGQEPSDPDEAALSRIPPGPAHDFAIKIRLKRSETSFTPIHHASLGLDAYTQATSPIRRYLDLCVQRQMLEYLRSGKAAYTLEEFEAINAAVQESLAVSGAVSRESKRYWIFRYLEKIARSGRRIRGVVVRTDLKFPLVELDEVFIAVPARIAGEYRLGDEGLFKITTVDALSDFIRIESAGPLGA